MKEYLDEEANYLNKSDTQGPAEKNNKICFSINLLSIFNWFKNKKTKENKHNDDNR